MASCSNHEISLLGPARSLAGRRQGAVGIPRQRLINFVPDGQGRILLSEVFFVAAAVANHIGEGRPTAGECKGWLVQPLQELLLQIFSGDGAFHQLAKSRVIAVALDLAVR